MYVPDQQQCKNGISRDKKSVSNPEMSARLRAEENAEGCFSAEEFVKNILEEGSKVHCDDTVSNFNKDDLPNFYDPVKFERAQKFFDEHVFALYVNKLFGLVLGLALPSIRRILRMTKMSGCIMSSYRRNIATLLHINTWYENNLEQDSRAIQSLRAIKMMHNSASKQARIKGMPSITQKDMALAQCGLIGLVISRAEMIGIHNASQDDLESLVHFWRVIGYILGIQDRFNVCRTSLKETRDICELLINEVLRPLYEVKNKEFLKVSSDMINGLWHMNPILNYKVFLSYFHQVLKLKSSNDNIEKKIETQQETYFNLSFYEKLYLKFIISLFSSLRFTFIRIYFNLQQLISLWITSRFPLLAVYRFGYRNSIVSIKLSKLKPHAGMVSGK